MAIPNPNQKPKTAANPNTPVTPVSVASEPKLGIPKSTSSVPDPNKALGGFTYGTDAAKSQALDANTKLWESDPTTKQAEIDRTLGVIKGMGPGADTSAQTKHLYGTLGYVPNPSSQNSTSANAVQSAPDQFQQWQTKQNELMSKYESLMNTPFQYNPETDPGYQAQRQLADLRAGDASKAAMETMNEKGILNSSLTSSQLAQIEQRAEQEAAAYIPQYRSEAYGQYQDKLRNAAEALNFATGRADRADEVGFRDDRAA